MIFIYQRDTITSITCANFGKSNVKRLLTVEVADYEIPPNVKDSQVLNGEKTKT